MTQNGIKTTQRSTTAQEQTSAKNELPNWSIRTSALAATHAAIRSQQLTLDSKWQSICQIDNRTPDAQKSTQVHTCPHTRACAHTHARALADLHFIGHSTLYTACMHDRLRQHGKRLESQMQLTTSNRCNKMHTVNLTVFFSASHSTP